MASELVPDPYALLWYLNPVPAHAPTLRAADPARIRDRPPPNPEPTRTRRTTADSGATPGPDAGRRSRPRRRPTDGSAPRNVSCSSTASTARCVAVTGAAPGGSSIGVTVEEVGRGPDRVVAYDVVLGRLVEHPAPRLRGDTRLARVGVHDVGGGEHPAVVGTTGPRPVGVDAAAAVDEHRAAAVLVVAHQPVALRQPGRREQQRRRDVREGVGLVGPDVDELRRLAARGARPARHVGLAVARDRATDLAEPHREAPRGHGACGRSASRRRSWRTPVGYFLRFCSMYAEALPSWSDGISVPSIWTFGVPGTPLSTNAPAELAVQPK